MWPSWQRDEKRHHVVSELPQQSIITACSGERWQRWEALVKTSSTTSWYVLDFSRKTQHKTTNYLCPFLSLTDGLTWWGMGETALKLWRNSSLQLSPLFSKDIIFSVHHWVVIMYVYLNDFMRCLCPSTLLAFHSPVIIVISAVILSNHFSNYFVDLLILFWRVEWRENRKRIIPTEDEREEAMTSSVSPYFDMYF